MIKDKKPKGIMYLKEKDKCKFVLIKKYLIYCPKIKPRE